MIIATTENIAGHRVVETLGQAFGVVVRSRGIGGNFMAGLVGRAWEPLGAAGFFALPISSGSTPARAEHLEQPGETGDEADGCRGQGIARQIQPEREHDG